jgi:hypothetical protein
LHGHGLLRFFNGLNRHSHLPTLFLQKLLLQPKCCRQIQGAVIQQGLDFLKRQTNEFQSDDLLEASKVTVGVQAISSLISFTRLEQAKPIIMVQGTHRNTGFLRKFTHFEHRSGSPDDHGA